MSQFIKKIRSNFYLLLVLCLIGQAIRVVYQSNLLTAEQLYAQQLQTESKLYSQEIEQLENELATLRSLHYLQTQLPAPDVNEPHTVRYQQVGPTVLASLEH